MARSVIAFVAAAGLALSSCGQGEEKPKPAAPSVPSATTPPGSSPTPGVPPGGVTASTPTAAASYTGTVQPAGYGITMQGSHKLVEGGAMVVLLTSTSKTVDLAKFEGKRVKVTGAASTTVEDGKTIVDVQTIVEAP